MVVVMLVDWLVDDTRLVVDCDCLFVARDLELFELASFDIEIACVSVMSFTTF